MASSIKCEDGKLRCAWVNSAPDFIQYHDTEWGFPVTDDYRLFEKICLEGFQSGLSWRTILTKRDNFRKAFHDFNFHKIAKFTEKDIEMLLQNEGIVRHRGKIEAVVNNAKCAIELIKTEGSLAHYFWQFEHKVHNRAQSVSTSAESIALSKDLKKRGWKFVGPTTVYAFMQAMGLLNDHLPDCVMHPKIEKARKSLKRP